jgi:hypothetical protein
MFLGGVLKGRQKTGRVARWLILRLYSLKIEGRTTNDSNERRKAR